MHSEELERFGRWAGELEVGYTTDWLGVRTRYAWECVAELEGFYGFVPSRRLACEVRTIPLALSVWAKRVGAPGRFGVETLTGLYRTPSIQKMRIVGQCE